MNFMDRAKLILKYRYSVFPCEPKGKKPLGRLAPNGVKDATMDIDKLKWWNDRCPDANTGVTKGIMFVVDIDDKNAGSDTIVKLAEKGKTLPPTLTVSSGHGKHFHYWTLGAAKNTQSIFPGVDTRAAGGYLIGPGSIHPNGSMYQISVDMEPSEAPQWLIDALPEHKKAHEIPDKVYKGGGRHLTILSLGGYMIAKGFHIESIESALRIENELRCDPPLCESEFRDIFRKVMKYRRNHG